MLYRQSKFYKHFNLIRQEIEDNILEKESFDEDNTYYNRDFFDVILKKYIPYLPLWSALTIINEEDVVRVSNATVENWFSVVKNRIIHTSNLQKCSRSVRLIRKIVLSYYKKEIFNIPKEGRTTRKRRIIDTSEVLDA